MSLRNGNSRAASVVHFPAMRKTGVVLVVTANVILLYGSLSAPRYARAHPHLDSALLAAYAAPWPVAVAAALAVAGIVLALIPLCHGERWAAWTTLGIWTVLLVTRMTTDPRCLVLLDPHQHGCHTFMIAAVFAIVGAGLVWRRQA